MSKIFRFLKKVYAAIKRAWPMITAIGDVVATFVPKLRSAWRAISTAGDLVFA